MRALYKKGQILARKWGIGSYWAQPDFVTGFSFQCRAAFPLQSGAGFCS